MTDQRLSALDATFLELEDADPSAHMHIGGVMIFSGVAPTQDELLARMEARLPALPRLRQQLSDVREGALHRLDWVRAPHFDPATHVRRAALPDPAGDSELLEWAGDFYSERLDRRRPLWEAVVIDNLAGDRWALASKMHHCLADGVGSLDALRLWADGAEALPATPPRGSDEPSVIDAVRAAFDLGLHPARTLKQSAAIAELAVRDEFRAAPHTSLNQPIGTRRRIADVEADLDGVKAIKRALGGRVNDVVLAAVTGGLRTLLLEREEALPSAGLRAMVPVNVRGDKQADMGNRILSLFVELPVGEPDPQQRYNTIRRQTAAAKAGRQPAGAAGLLGVGEWLPPVLHVPFAKSLFGRRLFNVTVTNIPGPPVTLHAFDSALERAIPIVPLAAEHAVGVAILSYGDRITFGVNADHDTVGDIGVLATAIGAELDLLGVIAARQTAARSRSLIR